MLILILILILTFLFRGEDEHEHEDEDDSLRSGERDDNFSCDSCLSRLNFKK